MSAIKNHYHDEICESENDAPDHQEPDTGEPDIGIEGTTDFDRGIWYRCAVSGMWYRNYDAAGAVSGVRIDGEVFERPAWWYQEQDKGFIDSLTECPFQVIVQVQGC